MGIATTIGAILSGLGAGDATAAAVAPILAGVGEGAAAGAGLSAVTGGNVGKGALTGALTGGLIPAGGEIGAGLGAGGATVGSALGGAAGGALGAGATGGNVGESALLGGLSGAVAPNLSDIGSALGIGGSGAAPVAVTETATGTPVPGGAGVATPSYGGGGVSAGLPSGAGSFSSAVDTAGDSGFTFGQYQNVMNEPSSLTLPASAQMSAIPGVSAANPSAIPGVNAAPSSSGILSSLGLGNLESVLPSKSSAALLASLGGLGLSAVQNQQAVQTKEIEQALLSQAQQQTANQQTLEQPLVTGNLPAGIQDAVNQATNSAIARVTANYASRGQDTNPNTNQSLAQDINNIQQTAVSQAYSLAAQLYQAGVSTANITGQLYDTLLGGTQAGQANLTTGLGTLSAALAA